MTVLINNGTHQQQLSGYYNTIEYPTAFHSKSQQTYMQHSIIKKQITLYIKYRCQITPTVP